MFRSSCSRLSRRLASFASRSFSSASSRWSRASSFSRFLVGATGTVSAAALMMAAPVLAQVNEKVAFSEIEPLTSYRLSILPERSQPLPSYHLASSKSLDELAQLFNFDPDRSPEIPLIFTKNTDNQFYQSMELLVRRAQDRICQAMLELELNEAKRKGVNPVPIREDLTVRPDGGGVTRVIQSGNVFSKAGCNTSVSNVLIPLEKVRDMAEDHQDLAEFFKENDKTHAVASDAKVRRFTASISLVLHSASPRVPTVHANYRFFEIVMPNGKVIAWFAGGSDLTPAFVNTEDAKFFHSRLKADCDKYDVDFYPTFKKQCDEYFYLPHRKERRGIGGIFFDDLREPAKKQFYYQFLKHLSTNFSASYFPLVLKHGGESFGPEEVEWKKFRASRYVEFNLLYDKGTAFGFRQPNARPESILVSMPREALWDYKPEFPQGSDKELTMNILRYPIDWVNAAPSSQKK